VRCDEHGFAAWYEMPHLVSRVALYRVQLFGRRVPVRRRQRRVPLALLTGALVLAIVLVVVIGGR